MTRNIILTSLLILTNYVLVISGHNRNDYLDFSETEYAVLPKYPYPFNPETTIKYQIPTNGNETLKVFNVLRREVVTRVNEFQMK